MPLGLSVFGIITSVFLFLARLRFPVRSQSSKFHEGALVMIWLRNFILCFRKTFIINSVTSHDPDKVIFHFLGHVFNAT